MVNGKIVLYEKGMIFVDNKAHALALPYNLIEKLNFYVGSAQWWLEIITCENDKSNLYVADMFPLNNVVQKRIYLKIDQKFFDERFEYLEKELLIDTGKDGERKSKATKLYDACPLVHDSRAMQNFFFNQKYNAQYSSDFMNLHFNWNLYQEYMEYNAFYEFNKIKSKEFIPLSAFSKVYREAD